MPGSMLNPTTQEIMGRAIVSDTQGNLARKAAEPKPKRPGLDPELRAIQVQGAAERMRAEIEASNAARIAGIQSQSKLFGFDQQMGQQGVGAGVGAEAFLKAKHAGDLRVIQITSETQSRLLEIETTSYQERVKLGFKSTQEKFQAEEAYKTKVQEINAEIAKSVQQFQLTQQEGEAEQAVLRASLQEQAGQRMVESIRGTWQIGEDLRHRDQDNALAYYQNLAKFQEAYGTSRENQMTTEYDMVRANLAKQLDVTQDTATKVLNAWRNGDSIHAAELLEGTQRTWDEVTTIMMGALADQRAVSEKFSDDFFAGFAKSMKKYVDDQSVFGLGIDQARRVAQGMEQGFQKFFFDAMEGRIQSFKDVVQGLVDFAKTVTSQLASQLITNSILRGITGVMSGVGAGLPGGSGGGIGGYSAGGSDFLVNLPKMAEGGITSGPTLAGEAGREAVVPLPGGRSIPVEWKGSPYSGQFLSTQMSMPVTVNVHNSANADVQTETRQGPDGNPQIDVYIKNVVRQGFRNGEFEGTMREFGATRQPRRRG